jgi:transposase
MKNLMMKIRKGWYNLLCLIARKPLTDLEEYYKDQVSRLTLEMQANAYEYVSQKADLTRRIVELQNAEVMTRIELGKAQRELARTKPVTFHKDGY